MKFVFITLFPELIAGAASVSILDGPKKKASLRFFASIPVIMRRTATAALTIQPAAAVPAWSCVWTHIWRLFEKARCLAPDALVAALTPVGETLCQARVTALSRAGRDLIFLCGHYEGFDERILEEADLRLSVGDFVMTGGELPALSVTGRGRSFRARRSGKLVSAEEDSFSGSLLEHPQYTRPISYEGKKVPDILLSGDHEKIGAWRRKKEFEATLQHVRIFFDNDVAKRRRPALS